MSTVGELEGEKQPGGKSIAEGFGAEPAGLSSSVGIAMGGAIGGRSRMKMRGETRESY